jgi:hypothetical protein
MTKPAPSPDTFGGWPGAAARPGHTALRDDPDMAAHPQASITIALSQPLMIELTEMAREGDTTEHELIQRAVEGLLRGQRAPVVPRFARRLGPLV